MGQPIATFILFAYNQERFIREAVRGALAQTYSPLQIIISDDCSRDMTFEIAQEEVAGYDGPHRVLLNRNRQNLGIAGHLNRAVELAEGDFIVVASGDDVSLPERTEELARVLTGEEVFAVYSNCFLLNEDNVERGTRGDPPLTLTKPWQEQVKSGHRWGAGWGLAWDRAVFDVFGPVPNDLPYEDVVIPFRAALLGKVAYVDKCLVKYRLHDANVSPRLDDTVKLDQPQLIQRQAATVQMYAKNSECMLRDVRLFASIHPEMETELLWAMDIITARIEFHKFDKAVWAGDELNGLRGRLRIMAHAKKLGIKPTLSVGISSLSPLIYRKLWRWWHQRFIRREMRKRADRR